MNKERSEKMSERERDIIKRISENVKGLSDEKKEYLLGVSDGMAIMEKADIREPVKGAV